MQDGWLNKYIIKYKIKGLLFTHTRLENGTPDLMEVHFVVTFFSLHLIYQHDLRFQLQMASEREHTRHAFCHLLELLVLNCASDYFSLLFFLLTAEALLHGLWMSCILLCVCV